MMAKRKEEELKQIRLKTTEQINEEIIDLKGELFMLHFQRSARNEFKSNEFRLMCKTVVHMLTVKRERERCSSSFPPALVLHQLVSEVGSESKICPIAMSTYVAASNPLVDVDRKGHSEIERYFYDFKISKVEGAKYVYGALSRNVQKWWNDFQYDRPTFGGPPINTCGLMVYLLIEEYCSNDFEEIISRVNKLFQWVYDDFEEIKTQYQESFVENMP
ncbi:hypothetical protein LguiB_004156 [Lonicera macranthoides]